jgi:hypothetical protein
VQAVPLHNGARSFPHMLRALLLALLVGVAIGALAWYAVAMLRQLLRAWAAGGCSLDALVNSVGLCR